MVQFYRFLLGMQHIKSSTTYLSKNEIGYSGTYIFVVIIQTGCCFDDTRIYDIRWQQL